MPITDNLIFRLKPKSGDTAPVSIASGAETMAGTVAVLVDRGAGDYVWRLSGTGDMTATIGSKLFDTTAGTGVTMAITMKVVTNPSGSFDRYAGYADSTLANGMRIGANGPPAARVGFGTVSGSMTTAIGTIGTTEFTWLVRLKASASSILDVWKNTVGRTGTAADFTSASAVGGSVSVNTAFLRAVNGDVIDVKDFVIWSRELTDAECAAVADGLRATLDVPSNTAVSSDLAATYAVSAYVTSDLGATYSVSSAMTSVSSDIGAAYNIFAFVSKDFAASYSVGSTSGTFVTEPWFNNTLWAPRGAQAVSYTWVNLGRVGSLTGKTLTEGTGTLSAGGVLTVTGLPAGAGFLLGAVLGTNAATDQPYYQAGTVT